MGAPGDGFNNWAFNRGEAIAADNAIAAQIVDDPAMYPNLGDASGFAPGLALAGYTYFPPMMGYPYLGYSTYGAWNPYIGSYYSPGFVPSGRYAFHTLYPGIGVTSSPGYLRFPSLGGGYHPITSVPIGHAPIGRAPGLSPSIPRSGPIPHPAVHGGRR